jgi:hypothetical protein
MTIKPNLKLYLKTLKVHELLKTYNKVKNTDIKIQSDEFDFFFLKYTARNGANQGIYSFFGDLKEWYKANRLYIIKRPSKTVDTSEETYTLTPALTEKNIKQLLIDLKLGENPNFLESKSKAELVLYHTHSQYLRGFSFPYRWGSWNQSHPKMYAKELSDKWFNMREETKKVSLLDKIDIVIKRANGEEEYLTKTKPTPSLWDTSIDNQIDILDELINLLNGLINDIN